MWAQMTGRGTNWKKSAASKPQPGPGEHTLKAQPGMLVPLRTLHTSVEVTVSEELCAPSALVGAEDVKTSIELVQFIW